MNTEAQSREDQTDDPLHVQLATALLVSALDADLPEFGLRQERSGLSVKMPDGSVTELSRFIAEAHPFDIDLSELVPAQLVFNRLLEMAGILGTRSTAGQIRLSLDSREPVLKATLRVVAVDDTHLQFEVIDRQEIGARAKRPSQLGLL